MINQGRLVKQDRVNLRPGESTTLSDGTVVRFDGAKEFANLQVGYDPAQRWVLVFAVTMMTGLLVSLVITRRRVWFRVHPGERGLSPVDMGGLARTDHAGWGPEFQTLRLKIWPHTQSPSENHDRETV